MGLVISAFGMIDPFGMMFRANATYDFSSAGQHCTVPKLNLTSAHETLLHNAQVLHETLRMQFSRQALMRPSAIWLLCYRNGVISMDVNGKDMTCGLISHFHAIATPNVSWCRIPSGSDQKLTDQLATSRARFTPKMAGFCCDIARFVLEPTSRFELETCGLRNRCSTAELSWQGPEGYR